MTGAGAGVLDIWWRAAVEAHLTAQDVASVETRLTAAVRSLARVPAGYPDRMRQSRFSNVKGPEQRRPGRRVSQE